MFRYEQFKVRLDKLGDELVKTCSEYFTEEDKQQEFLSHLRSIRRAFKPKINNDYLYNDLLLETSSSGTSSRRSTTSR